MRTLLQRDGLWSSDIRHYLTTTVKNFKEFIASSTSPPSRKFSLATINCNFNEFFAVDHIHLDHLRLIHFMDMVYRYSGYHISPTAKMIDVII